MKGFMLFLELMISDVFHFYDKPYRKLIKSDQTHYVSPEGRRIISPTVAVIKDGIEKGNNDGQQWPRYIENSENRKTQ